MSTLNWQNFLTEKWYNSELNIVIDIQAMAQMGYWIIRILGTVNIGNNMFEAIAEEVQEIQFVLWNFDQAYFSTTGFDKTY